MSRMRALENDVAVSARRLDAALDDLDREQRDVRRLARALSPKLLIGVGLAGGFLLMVLPRHLRGRTLIGLGRFALARLLPLFSARGDDE
ncbi:MAG: hypothetical protein AMXMBFR59_27260 [Rhodanobacteraceae bacterium]